MPNINGSPQLTVSLKWITHQLAFIKPIKHQLVAANNGKILTFSYLGNTN